MVRFRKIMRLPLIPAERKKEPANYDDCWKFCLLISATGWGIIRPRRLFGLFDTFQAWISLVWQLPLSAAAVSLTIPWGSLLQMERTRSDTYRQVQRPQKLPQRPWWCSGAMFLLIKGPAVCSLWRITRGMRDEKLLSLSWWSGWRPAWMTSCARALVQHWRNTL